MDPIQADYFLSERFSHRDGLPIIPDEFKICLEKVEKWIECYEKFDADYRKLVADRPSYKDPEEDKYKLLGIFTTAASKAVSNIHSSSIIEWNRLRSAELKRLIDRNIADYSELFYFREGHRMGSDVIMINGRRHLPISIHMQFEHQLREPIHKLKTIHTRYQKKLSARLSLDAKEEREFRASEKKKKNKALIAKVTGTSRNLGATVKKHLSSSHPCPYCGKALGTDFHADHIYPVIKGGLSTIQNMVNVCSSCNLAKRDLTLNAFIRKFGLNRDEIESRLETLDKEF